MNRTRLSYALSSALLATLASCANTAYVTPIEPVDLLAISDHGVRAGFAPQPFASYPAHVAIVRVQADAYQNAWRPITGVETLHVMSGARTGPIELEQSERIAELEGVVDVVVPNRLVLDDARLGELDDLRDEVAPLRPDLLLVYTLDTRVDLDMEAIGLVDLLTIGLLLEDRQTISCTASALVVDVRSGFVWSTFDAYADSEHDVARWFRPPPESDWLEAVEAEATDALVEQVVTSWPRLAGRVREAAALRGAVGEPGPTTSPGGVIEIP